MGLVKYLTNYYSVKYLCSAWYSVNIFMIAWYLYLKMFLACRRHSYCELNCAMFCGYGILCACLSGRICDKTKVGESGKLLIAVETLTSPDHCKINFVLCAFALHLLVT